MPNDVYIDQCAKVTFVNGANGSGKTTLLRTISLNVILAQIGCFVPCAHLAFTPFHFIFNYSAGLDKSQLLQTRASDGVHDVSSMRMKSSFEHELAQCNEMIS